jgi:thiamine-phosphate diphosphorylase
VLDASELRRRLGLARLYLVYTPSLVRHGDPLEALESVLPWIDLVQVRVKPADRGLDPARPARELAVTDARALFEECERVLERVRAKGHERVLVLANDRVDVARCLIERGLAGVHVGQDDAPPRVARELLGPAALIGFSTHSPAQVATATDEPVDYLGFGPLRATATKGYERGLGLESAWIAAQAAHVPVFPIGGIGLAEAQDLVEVGRAAVSSAILAAADPARAARALREALRADDR